jgi:hypothetical protein
MNYLKLSDLLKKLTFYATKKYVDDKVKNVKSGGYILTKSDVESVLTGEISSHTHAGGGGGLTQPQIMARSLGC